MTFDYLSYSVELQGAVLPMDISWQPHQARDVSLDGQPLIRDRSSAERLIKIRLSEDFKSHDDLIDFIVDRVKMQRHYFLLTPDSGVDLGGGAGTALYFRYWSSNFIENMVAFQNFDYELILRYHGTPV